jgi:hypothetical protein
MSQKTVERVLGKLATDEEYRQRFRSDPLGILADAGRDAEALTPVEREALGKLDPDLLDRFADALDPRLQRVRLPAAAGDGSGR